MTDRCHTTILDCNGRIKIQGHCELQREADNGLALPQANIVTPRRGVRSGNMSCQFWTTESRRESRCSFSYKRINLNWTCRMERLEW